MLTRRHFISFIAIGGLLARLSRKLYGTRDAIPARFWKRKGAAGRQKGRSKT